MVSGNSEAKSRAAALSLSLAVMARSAMRIRISFSSWAPAVGVMSGTDVIAMHTAADITPLEIAIFICISRMTEPTLSALRMCLKRAC
jgi:hypothetical protein